MLINDDDDFQLNHYSYPRISPTQFHSARPSMFDNDECSTNSEQAHGEEVDSDSGTAHSGEVDDDDASINILDEDDDDEVSKPVSKPVNDDDDKDKVSTPVSKPVSNIQPGIKSFADYDKNVISTFTKSMTKLGVSKSVGDLRPDERLDNDDDDEKVSKPVSKPARRVGDNDDKDKVSTPVSKPVTGMRSFADYDKNAVSKFSRSMSNPRQRKPDDGQDDDDDESKPSRESTRSRTKGSSRKSKEDGKSTRKVIRMSAQDLIDAGYDLANMPSRPKSSGKKSKGGKERVAVEPGFDAKEMANRVLVNRKSKKNAKDDPNEVLTEEEVMTEEESIVTGPL